MDGWQNWHKWLFNYCIKSVQSVYFCGCNSFVPFNDSKVSIRLKILPEFHLAKRFCFWKLAERKFTFLLGCLDCSEGSSFFIFSWCFPLYLFLDEILILPFFPLIFSFFSPISIPILFVYLKCSPS